MLVIIIIRRGWGSQVNLKSFLHSQGHLRKFGLCDTDRRNVSIRDKWWSCWGRYMLWAHCSWSSDLYYVTCSLWSAATEGRESNMCPHLAGYSRLQDPEASLCRCDQSHPSSHPSDQSGVWDSGHWLWIPKAFVMGLVWHAAMLLFFVHSWGKRGLMPSEPVLCLVNFSGNPNLKATPVVLKVLNRLAVKNF